MALLSNLDHPYIVKYFETYDDKIYLYLVMEYVKGEELFDKITREGELTEKQASHYIS